LKPVTVGILDTKQMITRWPMYPHYQAVVPAIADIEIDRRAD
jgi:hypothetical protein